MSSQECGGLAALLLPRKLISDFNSFSNRSADSPWRSLTRSRESQNLILSTCLTLSTDRDGAQVSRYPLDGMDLLDAFVYGMEFNRLKILIINRNRFALRPQFARPRSYYNMGINWGGGGGGRYWLRFITTDNQQRTTTDPKGQTVAQAQQPRRQSLIRSHGWRIVSCPFNQCL